MDNDNANIFAGGDSVNTGKPDGSSDGISGAGASTEGRIDPAIALAANAPGGSNSNGGTTRSPGQRGRHRNDCNCEPCVAKRKAAGSLDGLAASAEPKAAKSQNIRASFVEKSLHVMHLMASAALKAPELELDDDDAKKLGDAVAGVLAFYNVKMTRKQEAYALLMEAAAQIYPPMIVTLYIRKKHEADQARKNAPKPTAAQPNNVQTLRPSMQAAGPTFDPFNVKLDP